MKYMKKHRSEIWALFVMATAIILASQILLAAESNAQISKKTSLAKAHPAPQVATGLSLKTFIDQVAQGNEAYKAAEMNRRAAQGYAVESGLLLTPYVFANAAIISDAKPSIFLPYDRIETNTYVAGIGQNFRNGLTTRFSYTAADTAFFGLPTARAQFFEARPQIEATLPLWRNFWGREIMGQVDVGRLAALAKASLQEAQLKSVLVDAEASYWRLALAREALKVSQDSMSRAQATFDWSKRRVTLALSDRSEGLQSTAQLKARELDLKIAADEERSARLQFNSARGVNSDKVEESLDVMNAKLILKWETPSRTQARPDIEASRLQAEVAEANARMAGEKSKPTLELFGTYAFNSPQRSSQGDALSDSWKRDRPTAIYGVKLQMPLDLSTLSRVRQGWAAEAAASRTLVSRKMFEQERDWNDVVARFQLAREKIRLYEELEAAQKEKLDHERSRQKQGRSTLAQVILFESDYQQTQFARIRSLAEVLNLNAQMKLYGVAYAPIVPNGEVTPTE
jgi:outer membrane protein TolC